MDRTWVRLPLGTAQALGGGPVVWKQESVVLVRPRVHDLAKRMTTTFKGLGDCGVGWVPKGLAL